MATTKPRRSARGADSRRRRVLKSQKKKDLARLAIRYVDPSTLQAAPWNPRTITPERRARLLKGIQTFGLVDPLIVRGADSTVIGGHQRLAIARELELERVPVVFLEHLTAADAKALNVLLNNPEAQGSYADDELAAIVRELDEGGYDLTLTGFGDVELERLLRDVENASDDEEDTADLTLPTRPKSLPGKVYRLGTHALFCGDSTKPDAWRGFLGNARAEVLWTDPPYGVSYVGKTKRSLTIQNDGAEGLGNLLRGAFTAADSVMAAGARFYVAAPAGPRGTEFRLAITDTKWAFHQALVWVKDAMVLGHSDYHYRHEDVLYGWKPGSGRGKHSGSRWYGDHSQTSVFEIAKPSRNEEHPTMKPVALVSGCLANSSKRNDVVIDAFGGSGTTLVACEKLGRRARLIELDPRYCDVIRRRYAELVNDRRLAP